MSKKNEMLGRVVLLCAMVVGLSSAAIAEDVCGQSYVFLYGGQTATVGQGCVLYGQTVVADAALTLDGGVITEGGPGYADGWLLALEGSTVDIHSGTIENSLVVGYTAIVTVYGSAFAVNGTPQDESVAEIVNNTASPSEFVLSGLYQNGGAFSVPVVLDPDARINLGWPDVPPQTSPEIYVQPALLSWDFGDVEVGQSTTVLVQIYNYGTAALNVSSVTIAGDADFAITAGPAAPLVIAPNTSLGVDFEVTFIPDAAGAAAAIVQIVSDDADESLVEVVLGGVGIVVDVPPQQQIRDILNYFDASAAGGTLLGYGPGNSPEKRLNALRNMIEAASDLINAGAYQLAAAQLDDIAKKMDGVAKPQDFVVGDAVSVLNAKVNDLMADLAS
ncbi:MAG: choice-of-anchor D domain-containing protein [Planctomycetales bacterium]|nr:choice-of-anchor D domain-containing protein [Planctomycetales bacterium]